MKKQIATLAIIGIVGIVATAQTVITTPQLTIPLASPPRPVPGATVTVVGNSGNSTYYYWVVADDLIGDSSPAGPFVASNAPNVLSAQNYVTISPQPAAGALTYDVLRTQTPAPPTGACNCAVAIAAALGAIYDQGPALQAYTVTPYNPRTTEVTLTNQPTGAGASKLSVSFGGAQKEAFASDGSLTYDGLDVEGTLSATAGGTLSGGFSLASPTISGGTITNSTLTSPAISGGTVSNSTLAGTFGGTPTITSPTITSLTASSPAIAPTTIEGVVYADQFSGADVGAKIEAACAALPAAGGVIDAKNFSGTLSWATDALASCTKAVVLELSPAETFVSGSGPASFATIATPGQVIDGNGAAFIYNGTGVAFGWGYASSGDMPTGVALHDLDVRANSGLGCYDWGFSTSRASFLTCDTEAANQFALRLNGDPSGTGSYSNTIYGVNFQAQGVTTGTTGILATTSGSPLYRPPNANTFVGGQIQEFATAIQNFGGGNQYLGITVEGVTTTLNDGASIGGAFNTVASLYIEDAAQGYVENASAGGLTVNGGYLTGVTSVLSGANAKTVTLLGQNPSQIPAQNFEFTGSGLGIGAAGNAGATLAITSSSNSITALSTATTFASGGTGQNSNDFNCSSVDSNVSSSYCLAVDTHAGTALSVSNAGVVNAPVGGITAASLASSTGVTVKATTVAALPNAPAAGAGAIYVITDGSGTPGACTGGGSTVMLAVSNGSSWTCR